SVWVRPASERRFRAGACGRAAAAVAASVATTAFGPASRSTTATPPSVDTQSAGIAGSWRSSDRRTDDPSPAAAADSRPPCGSTPAVSMWHAPTSPDLAPASATAGDRSGSSFSPRELLQRVDRQCLFGYELLQSRVLALKVLQPASIWQVH